ncbi:MAG: hypothetical protein F9K16_13970, partial [Thermoanaerobaculia bacterium]
METRSAILRCFAAAALLGASACSIHPRGGTGDVAFRLVWKGTSDLDLMVEDPAGECVFYGTRRSASGGVLDVDCNGGDGRACPAPLENVYWPAASAPSGTYRLWAHAHTLAPAEAPLRFRLEVLRGARLVRVLEDAAREHQELVGPFTYTLPGGVAGAAAARAVAPIPACSGLATGMRVA